MKKLEEDETIKDKGEQTRAADCTLPKKAKTVQKMPRNVKNIQNIFHRLNKSVRFYITKKIAKKCSRTEFKICLFLF